MTTSPSSVVLRDFAQCSGRICLIQTCFLLSLRIVVPVASPGRSWTLQSWNGKVWGCATTFFCSLMIHSTFLSTLLLHAKGLSSLAVVTGRHLFRTGSFIKHEGVCISLPLYYCWVVQHHWALQEMSHSPVWGTTILEWTQYSAFLSLKNWTARWVLKMPLRIKEIFT